VVTQQLFNRSHDLIGLANHALREEAVPVGPALIEPRPPRPSQQSRTENPSSTKRACVAALAGFSLSRHDHS
jgi:hypothetical protein